MFEQIHILVCEVDPDLHPPEELVVFGRNEAEPIDMLTVAEILTQQEEHQIGVELVFVLLVAAH